MRSEVSSGMMGREALTDIPSRTNAAAWARFAGVIKFRVPISSSGPQRPQLEYFCIQLKTSSSVGMCLSAIESASVQGRFLKTRVDAQSAPCLGVSYSIGFVWTRGRLYSHGMPNTPNLSFLAALRHSSWGLPSPPRRMKSGLHTTPSLQRRLESREPCKEEGASWIPASAGMTNRVPYSSSQLASARERGLSMSIFVVMTAQRSTLHTFRTRRLHNSPSAALGRSSLRRPPATEASLWPRSGLRWAFQSIAASFKWRSANSLGGWDISLGKIARAQGTVTPVPGS